MTKPDLTVDQMSEVVQRLSARDQHTMHVFMDHSDFVEWSGSHWKELDARQRDGNSPPKLDEAELRAEPEPNIQIWMAAIIQARLEEINASDKGGMTGAARPVIWCGSCLPC